MGGNRRVMLQLLLATLVLSCVIEICSAKTAVVGGSTGWTIPSSSSFYSNWASSQKLQVGDVLVFTFPAASHTVAEVSKSNYDSCTLGSTLGPVMTTAPANITLTRPGTHYFICTITGHCGANQKLTVAVAASTPTPRPTSSPVASPTKSPTSSPAKSPASSPTPMMSPTPTPTPAPTPAFAPAPAPMGFSPSPTPDVEGPGMGSPMGGATVPAAAAGPGGADGGAATPPAGNFAARSAGVSLLSLVSVVASVVLF